MASEQMITVFRAMGHGQVIAAMTRIGAAARVANQGVRSLAVSMAVLRAGSLAVATIAGAMAGIDFAGLKTAASFETLRAELDAVMGSAERGKQAFGWASQFERNIPASLQETIGLMIQMQSLQLNPFKDLGTVMDMALGDVERARHIITQLGQINMAGPQAEELRSLVEGGRVPAYDIVQRALGLTGEQVRNIGEMKVNKDSVVAAILEWGRTDRLGAAARQMDTLAGRMSNLRSARDKFLNAIGMTLAPMATKAIEQLTAWFDDRKNVENAVRFTAMIAEGLVSIGPTLKALFDSVEARLKAILDHNLIAVWAANLGDRLLMTIIQVAKALSNFGLRWLEKQNGLGNIPGFGPAPGVEERRRTNNAFYDEKYASIKSRLEKRMASMKSVYAATSFNGADMGAMFRRRVDERVRAVMESIPASGAPPSTGERIHVEEITKTRRGGDMARLISAILMGGGQRFARGVSGTDVARNLMGGPRAIPVRLSVNAADGSPLAQAIVGIIRDYETKAEPQKWANPAYRRAAASMTG